jgi:hypothetical protein
MISKIVFKIFVIILFFILYISSGESQSLKSISGKDTEMKKKNFACFYNLQYNDDIGSFDIKPEFLLDFWEDNPTYIFGITLEVELTSSKKTSWVITSTPLIRRDSYKEYLRILGISLTGGGKFYFNNGKVRGYFLINGGFLIGNGFRLALSPNFGLEYKFSEAVKFETEIKSPLFFPVFIGAAVYPGINAGVGFLF